MPGVGGSTVQAADIHRLWEIFLLATIFVGGTTYALIFWCLVRYRRKDDRQPPQFKDQHVVEGVCAGIAVAIVIVLFIFSFNVERFVDRDPPNAAVYVRVTGFQWSWRFQYLGGGPTIIGTTAQAPVMVVPVGQPVHITITSADVVHAFFVPAFYFKRQAIPGFTSTFDFTVTRPGVYLGECAEFCGLNHAFMGFSVDARSPQAFAAWLARERGTKAQTP